MGSGIFNAADRGGVLCRRRTIPPHFPQKTENLSAWLTQLVEHIIPNQVLGQGSSQLLFESFH